MTNQPLHDLARERERERVAIERRISRAATFAFAATVLVALTGCSSGAASTDGISSYTVTGQESTAQPASEPAAAPQPKDQPAIQPVVPAAPVPAAPVPAAPVPAAPVPAAPGAAAPVPAAPVDLPPQPLDPPTITRTGAFPGLQFQSPQITVNIYTDVTAAEGVSYVALRVRTPTGSSGPLSAGLVSGTKFEGRWSISYLAECRSFPAGSAMFLTPTVTDNVGNVVEGAEQIISVSYVGNGKPFTCP